MKFKNNITGIILAGGKSSRMGTEKGLIIYKNKPFVEHIIEAMSPLVDNIIIISNNKVYESFGFKCYEDLIKNTGPLAGIYTGLRYSKTDYNLIVSCDIPLVKTIVLQKLIDQKNDASEVIQLQSQGKNMPLIALYKKSCEVIFKKELHQNQKKVQTALKKCNVKTVVIDESLEQVTANINTPEDLELLNFNL
ncbi:MAG: molybdenum cofactor guanylyltransferase [Flavobacteriaceae bacterium]|nr:molybdenum cofactor guanylyltransferase [Flavobacteriaceae bacterium]